MVNTELVGIDKVKGGYEITVEDKSCSCAQGWDKREEVFKFFNVSL